MAASAGSNVEPGAPVDASTEWLEPDGLGGFASGTTSGLRTRRYHALLLSAARPPADRRVLVQGFLARLDTPAGSSELWPQAYAGGWETGRDAASVSFSAEPWPNWHIATRFGVALDVELFVPRGHPLVVLAFRLDRDVPGARLTVRPLLSGRDFHALHRDNPVFDFRADQRGPLLRFHPYQGVPGVQSLADAHYEASPEWFRNFWYAEEAARGFESTEDLASPGVLCFDLGSRAQAVWLLQADTAGALPLDGCDARALAERLRTQERERRRRFSGPLERAAAAYVVERGRGRTILAGYPWFGDWGRDTFIAVRGICLANGDLDGAAAILGEWASVVSEGMLPNRFPDDASAGAEYNSVDASLWFVLAADELLRARDGKTPAPERQRLEAAIAAIVQGYARGTRYGIRAADDGLLAAGVPGAQLTWMDAKVGDHVVTPRIGKPVEVQALWIHALECARARDPSIAHNLVAARAAFASRFWNPERGMLFDVVDVDHVAGKVDARCRPNQIFAAGGLPVTLLSPARARAVVDAVERELWVPLGLRSLERSDARYIGRYAGSSRERDNAYHQGSVWPWLIGPFVEAWVKSRGASDEARREARSRFVEPLLQHLATNGLGHVSEIADGDPPHVPRGCPFQAWSVSELVRLERSVLPCATSR